MAKLLEFNFALNFLFILFAPIVYLFTLGANQFYQSILTHILVS